MNTWTPSLGQPQRGQKGVAQEFLCSRPEIRVRPPAELMPIPGTSAREWRRRRWIVAVNVALAGMAVAMAFRVLPAGWVAADWRPLVTASAALVLGIGVPWALERLLWSGVRRPTPLHLLDDLVPRLRQDPETAAIAQLLWQAQGNQIRYGQYQALCQRLSRETQTS